MNLTFNPTDYENIVAKSGEPPADESFTTCTDETIERGFVRISGEVDGVSGDDVVPLFVAGIPPELAMSADEVLAAAEAGGSPADLLGSILNDLFGDKLIEMNPAELARATDLFGPSPVSVEGNDEVPIGWTRVNGDLADNTEVGIRHGVLAYAEDGSVYVTSGDVTSDVEFSA